MKNNSIEEISPVLINQGLLKLSLMVNFVMTAQIYSLNNYLSFTMDRQGEVARFLQKIGSVRSTFGILMRSESGDISSASGYSIL